MWETKPPAPCWHYPLSSHVYSKPPLFMPGVPVMDEGFMNAGCCPNVFLSVPFQPHPWYNRTWSQRTVQLKLWARNSQDDVTCHRTLWKQNTATSYEATVQSMSRHLSGNRNKWTNKFIPIKDPCMLSLPTFPITNHKNQQTYKVNRSYMDPIIIWKKWWLTLRQSFSRFFWTHPFWMHDCMVSNIRRPRDSEPPGQ